MFVTNPRRKGEKMCNLCNLEKTAIAVGDPNLLLNKRSEILRRCRHRDKLVLSNNLTRHRKRRAEEGRQDALDPVQELPDEDAERGPGPEEVPTQGGGRPQRSERVDYRSFF